MSSRPGRAITDRPPYGLILAFMLYGPTINVMGELRYVEIILLGILFLRFRQAGHYVGKLEKRFILLFILAAFAHFVSDLINDVLLPETVKRVGTYLFLAILIIPVQFLARNDPKRVAFILIGYCLSFVLMLFIGMSTNSAYAEMPWRLGLGHATAILVCLSVVMFPRWRNLAGPLLLVTSAFYVVMDARNLGGITFASGVLSLLAFASNNKFPLKFRPDYVSMVALLGLVGFIGSMAMLRYAVEAKVFDGELQAKMERQISHPYGLLIGGRPQTAASLYAISKKPIFGHGTTAYDPEVWNLLTAISIMNYFGSDRYEQLLEMGYNPRHRHHATPSHSHLLSAWSDAGIMAALCWLAFLGLTVYVLLRAMLWNNPWSPLFTYLSLTALWNILFSPGPVRMDTALTVMVFAFAVHLFQAFDKMEATRLRT